MPEVWLITGAAGFIGSNAAEHLLSQGHTVIGLDNLSSGDIRNVDPFYAMPNWHWYLGNINDSILEEIFQKHVITHVLHLAAVVSVQACEEFPDDARRINEQGFERVLTLSLAQKIKQLIYASSSAVYGAAEHMPIAESTPLEPLSLYGRTKLNNEIVAQRDCQGKNISCIGMRFFNLFGPRQGVHSAYAAVIPKWADAIKKNKTPIIYGDGSATRDFCHIDNVLSAIDCSRKVLPQGHHVFNIGNGETTTLNELYEMICEALAKHPTPQYLPWQPEHIFHSCADISLATAVLDYRPVVSLEEGLRNTLTPSNRLL